MLALWLLLLLVIVGFFFIGGLLWWGVKRAVVLAVNSVLGFFALYALQLVMPSLAINFWSVILVALFGIFGLILVVALHLFGLAF